MQDVLKAFEQLNLLSVLGEADKQRISAHAQVLNARNGEILARVGSVTTQILFILEGSAKTSHVSREGKEALVALLAPGAHIGLVSLLSSLPRTTDVHATSRCRLLKIDGAFFYQELKRLPELCHSLLCSLAFRLEQTSRHFMDVAILNLNHRLFSRLFELAVTVELDGVEKLLVRKRPSHQDLASMLGSSREAITRSLKFLEEQGHIVVIDDQILVVSTP